MRKGGKGAEERGSRGAGEQRVKKYLCSLLLTHLCAEGEDGQGRRKKWTMEVRPFSILRIPFSSGGSEGLKNHSRPG